MSNIIESLGGNSKVKIGESCNIQDLCLIQASKGNECKVGDRVFIGSNTHIIDSNIGEGAVIGCGVRIYP